MLDDSSAWKDWSRAGPKVPNQPNVFVGYFAGRWNFLLAKKGGPVRGQPSMEHALLIEMASPETRDEACKPHLTTDIRRFYTNGRCVVRPDWEQVRDAVLWELLLEKYGVTPGTDNKERAESRMLLIDTHPAYLEDGNVSCDNWFGCCRCPNCKRELGINMHGRFLQKLRALLINPK